tara:strand:- start:26530 stop:28572 length:2043 start_codon:yes stop_codon:yes gene_type:complete
MSRKTVAQKGFLARLRRNEAGNVLAMTAAGIFPLMGLIGGGVDISRIYLVKTRVQQACDAGALAGRKAQSGGTWTSAHQTTANNIFDTNYQSGAYGTNGLTRTFTENDGKVTGTVSVTVPMMIMDMFGYDQKVLNVTCDAEMRLPHSDIMFVLDVTGSMNCAPEDSSCVNNGNVPATGSKIEGLQTAVQCFYEILMRTDTPENCGSTPTGGISDDVQVRFGFVPYNVNVNVGKLLNNDWIADDWTYQSRKANFTTENVITGYTPGSTSTVTNTSYSNTTGNWGSWSTWQTYTGVTSRDDCDDLVPNDNYAANGSEGSPYGGGTYMSGGNQITYWYTDQPAIRYTYDRESYNGRNDICKIERRQRNAEITRTYSRIDTPIYEEQEVFSNWTYEQVNHPVSGLKAGGNSWNSSVSLPIGTNGTNTTVDWDGCIEERQTVRATDFDPIPSGAKDLDIDTVPSSGDSTTQWGPVLSDAVFMRTWSYDPVTTTGNYNHPTAYCPTESRRLERYTTTAQRDDFVAYVNGLEAIGNTYHDIGLLWGARLMSPTGIFAADNDFTPQGGEIERHLIFMTDGDTMTANTNYTAYGVPWWDRRTTSESSAPSTNDLDNNVNARFEALCTAIKNKNITLWVINYGGGVSTGTGARLLACASPSRYYEATSVSALLTTFQQIAAQISQLRLTN